MKALLVFLAMVAVDFCWARYVIMLAEKNRLPASAWSAAIVVLGAYVVVEYVGNPKLILAAGAGAFVGTYLSMPRAKN